MSKSLTVQEQEEFNKASNILSLDAETKRMATHYFLEYKTKIKQTSPDRIPIVVNCAILAAAKSQVLTTVTGETIKGVGISTSQILRALDMSNNHVDLNHVLSSLREFINVVTLSHDISVELQAIIDKFAFSFTFFVKFNELFKRLELDPPMAEHAEYLRYFKNFGWLLYITSRSTVLHNRIDLIESVFLLSAIVTHLIHCLPKEIPVPFFLKEGRQMFVGNTTKKDETAIQDGIFDLLKLTKIASEDVQGQIKQIKELIKKLIDNGVLKSTFNNELSGIYDPTLLTANFESLENYYQKKLNFDDLDERFFGKDRRPIHQGMLTPFPKQRTGNGINININIVKNGGVSQTLHKTFTSPKCFDEKGTENISMGTRLDEIGNSMRNVPPSPYSKAPPATPMTRALENYNWLSEKVKLKKNASGLTPDMERHMNALDNQFNDIILSRANSIIEKVLNYEKELTSRHISPNIERNLSKHAQAISLYMKVLEELLNQEERRTRNPNYVAILSNEDFHRALIACSIETVFFVSNSSSVNFNKLLELCEIQAFEFWRIIGSFAKFDPTMPYPIKKHLHSIELRILMGLGWKKGSVVHELIKKFIEENDSSVEAESPATTHSLSNMNGESSSPGSAKERTTKTELTHSQELFFKRVLHHAALHIKELTELLSLGDEVAEQIWSVMKYILSSETTLLIDRHIDQLVLSTVYGVCKVLHHPLKFQEIIAKYQELPSFDKTEFLENIHQVHIAGEEKSDLIKFYNTVYISQMKTYLFALAPSSAAVMRPGTPQIKKPLVPALVINSPLRQSLPQPPPSFGSMNVHARVKSPMVNPSMTPATRALYAFGESPSRALTSINHFASKVTIDFDDPQEKESPGLEPSVLKKVKSSILDKIMEQRNEDSETERPSATQNRPFLGGAPMPSFMSRFASSNNDDSAAPAFNIGLLQRAGSFSQPRPQVVVSPTPMIIETPNKASSSSESQQHTPEQAQTSPTLNAGFKKVQKKSESPEAKQ